MKKTTTAFCVILSAALMTLFTACAPQTSNDGGNTDGTANEFGVRPLGSANDSAVWSVSEADKTLEFGFCSVVDYGTEGQSRNGKFTKLYSDISRTGTSTWHDFNVTSAFSAYSNNALNDAHLLVQSVRLEGEVSLSGTAEYLTSGGGNPIGISIILDEESRAKLPSLKPYSESSAASEADFTEERIYFVLSEENQYYSEIAEALDRDGKTIVHAKTDDFVLEWTDIGILTDGNTNGKFKNIISLSCDA